MYFLNVIIVWKMSVPARKITCVLYSSLADLYYYKDLNISTRYLGDCQANKKQQEKQCFFLIVPQLISHYLSLLGFYELSDGTSGSLSNSSNSVFSECLSSCRSTSCLCAPLDTSFCTSEGRLKSAGETPLQFLADTLYIGAYRNIVLFTLTYFNKCVFLYPSMCCCFFFFF